MNFIIEMFGDVGGPVILLLVLMYGLVALFLPFIILGIYNQACKAANFAQASAEILAESSKQSERVLRALETQNALNRQLLRAYGHEPEA